MSMITQDNLEGQRALVTGATSGIGRAVALQLARDGAEVLVHGRDAARGAETVQEITDAGGKASFVAADLGDAADVQRLARDVGDVDILINNAGIALFSPTAEFDVSAFDKMFASNVRAPFFLVAAIAPGMAARGRGSIVSVSSMAGGVGLVGGAAYGATKASLEAMTRAWAAEYSESGVRVNAIAPGPVYTPSPSGPGVHHGARRDHADAPRVTARGDRRGHRLPRIPAGELHHRHHRRRRRWTQSDLTGTTTIDANPTRGANRDQPVEPVAGTESSGNRGDGSHGGRHGP